ncbi:MobF family relaxase [Hyella patelloides]|uniref:MobF family relaxase n=1 Tax=Hyella patelloides TaxID=1982969 RepID=UPI00164389A9|nr:MobF family relaxase [Hyella patelloides]
MEDTYALNSAFFRYTGIIRKKAPPQGQVQTTHKITGNNKRYYEELGAESYYLDRDDAHGFFSGAACDALKIDDYQIRKGDKRVRLLFEGKNAHGEQVRSKTGSNSRDYRYLFDSERNKKVIINRQEEALLRAGDRTKWTQQLHARVKKFGHEANPEQYLVKKRHEATLGFDHVFSAPKDVSILWAFAQGELKNYLLKAHQEAVEEAKVIIEQNTYIRKGAGGAQRVKADAVFAQFHHELSRDGDMQLHDHVVQFNLGITKEGSAGALEGRHILKTICTSGMVYQNSLRRSCEQIGLRTYDRPFSQDKGCSFGIHGISEKVRDGFSQRSVRVREHLTATMTGVEIRNEFIKTRKRKIGDLATPAHQALWETRAQALNFEYAKLLGKATLATLNTTQAAQRIPAAAAVEPPQQQSQGTQKPSAEYKQATTKATPQPQQEKTKQASVWANCPPRPRPPAQTTTKSQKKNKNYDNFSDQQETNQVVKKNGALEHWFVLPRTVVELYRNPNLSPRRKEEIYHIVQAAKKDAQNSITQHTFTAAAHSEASSVSNKRRRLSPRFADTALDLAVTDRVLIRQYDFGLGERREKKPIDHQKLQASHDLTTHIFYYSLQYHLENARYATEEAGYVKGIGHSFELAHTPRKENTAEQRSTLLLQHVQRTALRAGTINQGLSKEVIQKAALLATRGRFHPHKTLATLTPIIDAYFHGNKSAHTNTTTYTLNQKALDRLSVKHELSLPASFTEKLTVSTKSEKEQLTKIVQEALKTTKHYLATQTYAAYQASDHHGKYQRLAPVFSTRKATNNKQGREKTPPAGAESITLYQRSFGVNEQGKLQEAHYGILQRSTFNAQQVFINTLQHLVEKQIGYCTQDTPYEQKKGYSFRVADTPRPEKSSQEILNDMILRVAHKEEHYEQRNKVVNKQQQRLVSKVEYEGALLVSDRGSTHPQQLMEREEALRAGIAGKVPFEKTRTRTNPFTGDKETQKYKEHYYALTPDAKRQAYYSLTFKASDEIALVYHLTQDEQIKRVIDYATECALHEVKTYITSLEFQTHEAKTSATIDPTITVKKNTVAHTLLPQHSSTVNFKAYGKGTDGKLHLIDKTQVWHIERVVHQLFTASMERSLSQFGINTYRKQQHKKNNYRPELGIEGLTSKQITGFNLRWLRMVRHRKSVGSLEGFRKSLKEAQTTQQHEQAPSPCSTETALQTAWSKAAKHAGINVQHIGRVKFTSPVKKHAHIIEREVATSLFLKQERLEEKNKSVEKKTSPQQQKLLTKDDVYCAFLSRSQGALTAEEAFRRADSFIRLKMSVAPLGDGGATAASTMATPVSTATLNLRSVEKDKQSSQVYLQLNVRGLQAVTLQTHFERITKTAKAVLHLYRTHKQQRAAARRKSFEKKAQWQYATWQISRKQYLQIVEKVGLPENKFMISMMEALGTISKPHAHLLNNRQQWEQQAHRSALRTDLLEGNLHYNNAYDQRRLELQQQQYKEKARLHEVCSRSQARAREQKNMEQKQQQHQHRSRKKDDYGLSL